MNLIAIIGFFLLLTSTTDSSLLDPVIENVRHIKATHPPEKVTGVWRKKMLWKPRWIKEWKSSNVVKPVWRKFWGPVIIREWVPIPKPPPQWDAGVHSHESHSTPPTATFVDVNEPPAPNFSYLHNNPSSDSYAPTKPPSNVISVAVQPNYKIPHLPITTGYKTQAETYSGQSSYGTNVDNTAYDLNPPVENYKSDYSYRPSSVNHGSVPPLSAKPSISHSHIHLANPLNHHRYHHHHHHQVKTNGNSYPDLTKFPPNWSSWQPVHPKPLSGLAQAGSAVSVVSQLESTTPKPHEAVGNHLLPQGLLPADNEFIQEAALISEYHYTEHSLQNPTSAPPPSLHSYVQQPIVAALNQTQSHVSTPVESLHVPLPQPTTIQPLSLSVSPSPVITYSPVVDVPQRPPSLPPSTKPHHKPTSSAAYNTKSVSNIHVKPNHVEIQPSISFPAHVQPVHAHINSLPSHANAPIVHSHPTPQSSIRHNPIHPRKPSPPPAQAPSVSIRHPNSSPPKNVLASKPELSKEEKKQVKKHQTLKVPDFKVLPSTSVQAFHYIEGFPTNQTLTKAALIGNINHTGVEDNGVEIISGKPNQKEIPPYVAKLAQAIVSEHLKKMEKENSTLTEKINEITTERPMVTIVYPSTNPFVRKTLKAYLADENSAEKSTKVFVVTPIPHATVNSSEDITNGVR